MSANEFSVDRVDSLNNIASTTPATNDKDKRRRQRQPSQDTADRGVPAADAADDDPVTNADGHTIDFQA